jgi:acyl-CoA synthetase
MNTILTLHDPEEAAAYYASGAWQKATLYSSLAEHARMRPDAYALRDGRHRLTWAQLLGWVDALAGQLHGAGLKQGQRVAVWLPNRVETVIVYLACSRNGYVCNPSVHQNFTTAEVMTLLGRIRASALFAQPGYGADADRVDVFAAAGAVPSLKVLYCLQPPGSGRLDDRYAAFPKLGERAGQLPEPVLNPDKITYLAFTSGTTGLPKGVLHSDNTLLANGRAMVKDWGHTASTILLSHSPLSHHIATVGISQALAGGFEFVINDLKPGQKPLDWILETGATYVMGVPTHAIDILSDMRSRGMERLGKVNLFYMAGSTIPPQTAKALLDMGVKPQNIYGMTETGSHQYTFPDDDAETITTTCGRACHGYETRLWDRENPDIEAAQGEIGEIGTRGALRLLGYFDNQAATEDSFNAGGWFMSGDLGRFDERGNLQIVGRKKDMIIRGGHNIFPARVENLSMKHASVFKAAAIPIPDERLGERVCLVLTSRGGGRLDAMEMLAHLDEQGLSKYDMPEFFLQIDEFPLTASGKILKRELVEWVREGRITPVAVRWTPPQKR